MDNKELKCPICGGEMKRCFIGDSGWMVNDQISVYQCQNYLEDRFWSHPFNTTAFFHNEKVTLSDSAKFTKARDVRYDLIDNKWVKS